MNGQPFNSSLRLYLLQQRGRLVIEQSSWCRYHSGERQKLRRVGNGYWLIRATRLELKRNSCRRIYLLIERNSDCITNDWSCHAR